jgi:hypothetical protein
MFFLTRFQVGHEKHSPKKGVTRMYSEYECSEMNVLRTKDTLLMTQEVIEYAENLVFLCTNS